MRRRTQIILILSCKSFIFGKRSTAKTHSMYKKLVSIFSFSLLLCFSCKDKVGASTEVYSNDFQSGNLNNITNGVIDTYNNTKVLGRYNNSEFTLSLNNLPKHDLITVTFALYIHDSWDGNSDSPDGPDMWEMYIDNQPYMSTTFSNYPCAANTFCKPQSYPNSYPNNYNNPKTGAATLNLPPACKTTFPNGTTKYIITKTFSHKGSTLSMKCLDKLVQTNDSNPKCDESWSVDDLKVTAVALQ